MKTTQNYVKAVQELVEEFRDKYYTYDDGSKADYSLVDEATGPVEICDDRWSIDEMYFALTEGLKYDKMIERKELEMDSFPDRPKVNFVKYCKYGNFKKKK